jgi:hypothetical protein
LKDLASPEFPVSDVDAEKIMLISLPIGKNSVLMANDVPTFLGKVNENENRSKISVNVDSKEEADVIFNGLSVGGQVEAPVAARWRREGENILTCGKRLFNQRGKTVGRYIATDGWLVPHKKSRRCHDQVLTGEGDVFLNILYIGALVYTFGKRSDVQPRALRTLP